MKRSIGFLAIAGLLLIAAPADRAHALSLVNPGTAATMKYASENLGVTTDVHWRHGHRGWHRHWGWHRHHWRRHWGWRHHHWHHRHHRFY